MVTYVIGTIIQSVCVFMSVATYAQAISQIDRYMQCIREVDSMQDRLLLYIIMYTTTVEPLHRGHSEQRTPL